MTAQARRPGPALWSRAWGVWIALFLVIELTGVALTPDAVGTLSVHVWGEWFPEPWARGVFLLFWTVVGVHFANRGRHWYANGRAVAITGALAGLVALWHERRRLVGLGKLVSDVKLLLKLRAARERLREAGKMGKLKAVLWGLAGAVGAGAVAQVTGACPGLLSQASPILLAGVGGAIAYFAQRPLTKVGAKVAGLALLGGALGAAGTAAAQVIDQVCGGGFVKSIPTIAAAGAWMGFMLWLRPDKTPKADLGSVKPTAPKY